MFPVWQDLPTLPWLQYWAVLAAATLLSLPLDFFLAWLPGYNLTKGIFMFHVTTASSMQIMPKPQIHKNDNIS